MATIQDGKVADATPLRLLGTDKPGRGFLSHKIIVTRQILPNVMCDVIVSIMLGVPAIGLPRSFLGKLGFAVKRPLISRG
jgi:hypothetical protein